MLPKAVIEKMEISQINDILDRAAKEVGSWPYWAQQGQVRVTEPHVEEAAVQKQKGRF